MTNIIGSYKWIGYQINLTADVYMEFYTNINPAVID